jgi:hypothetical protein
LRTGAVEAFIALPNQDYCELVRKLHNVCGAPSAPK